MSCTSHRSRALLLVWVPILSLGARHALAEEVLTTKSLRLTASGFFQGALHYDSNAAANRPFVNLVTGNMDRDALSFDPYASRLGVGVESLAPGPRARGLLEIDWGSVSAPRLRHAFVALDLSALSVLIGQTWIPFETPGPDTYNPQWLFREGNPYVRAPQLTLSRALGPVTLSATVTTADQLGGQVIKGNGASGTYSLAELATPSAFVRASFRVREKSFVALTTGAGSVDAVYTGPDPRTRPSATTGFAELSTQLSFRAWNVAAKLFWARGAGMGTGVGQALLVDTHDVGHAISAAGGFVSARVRLRTRFALAAFGGWDDPVDDVAGVQVPIRRNFAVGGNLSFAALDRAVLAIELERVATMTATPAGDRDFIDLRPSLVARYDF